MGFSESSGGSSQPLILTPESLSFRRLKCKLIEFKDPLYSSPMTAPRDTTEGQERSLPYQVEQNIFRQPPYIIPISKEM